MALTEKKRRNLLLTAGILIVLLAIVIYCVIDLYKEKEENTKRIPNNYLNGLTYFDANRYNDLSLTSNTMKEFIENYKELKAIIDSYTLFSLLEVDFTVGEEIQIYGYTNGNYDYFYDGDTLYIAPCDDNIQCAINIKNGEYIINYHNGDVFYSYSLSGNNLSFLTKENEYYLTIDTSNLYLSVDYNKDLLTINKEVYKLSNLSLSYLLGAFHGSEDYNMKCYNFNEISEGRVLSEDGLNIINEDDTLIPAFKYENANLVYYITTFDIFYLKDQKQVISFLIIRVNIEFPWR